MHSLSLSVFLPSSFASLSRSHTLLRNYKYENSKSCMRPSQANILQGIGHITIDIAKPTLLIKYLTYIRMLKPYKSYRYSLFVVSLILSPFLRCLPLSLASIHHYVTIPLPSCTCRLWLDTLDHYVAPQSRSSVSRVFFNTPFYLPS